MTITVEGPNGVVIDFPDGTDAATINNVMQKAVGGAASSGPLANSGDDGIVSGASKGAATGAIKGVSNSLGTVGNLGQFADYLHTRATKLVTGKSEEEIVADKKRLDEQRRTAQPGDSLLTRGMKAFSRGVEAVHPANVLPSGETISRPILDVTGEYKPESTEGRMAQAAVEAVTGMVGPGGGARAPGASLKEVLVKTPTKFAPANAAAGAVGQGVTELTDDPLLGMGAGNAVAVAGSMANAAARRAGRFATTAGREQMTGERILREAQNPDKVRADLEFQPAEQVPGSKLTTAQVTEDMGLLQAERRARNEAAQGPDAGNTPFNIRDAEQNAARLEAIERSRGAGDPMQVTQTFQQHLDALDTATQAAIDGAAQRAQAGAQQLGPAAAPEALGQQMREALSEAYQARRAQVDALYKAVDPDSSLRVSVMPLQQAAQRLAEQRPKFGGAAAPSGGHFHGGGSEADTIVKQVQSLPEVIQFSDLRELDQTLSKAMAVEKRTKGETQEWSRLVALKSAVKETINNAVAHQAAWEQAQVQQGLMRVGDTIDARLTDFLRATVGNPTADGAASSRVPGVAADGNIGSGGAAFSAPQGRGGGSLVPGVSAAEGRRAPPTLMEARAARDADLRARRELEAGLQEQGLPPPEKPIADRAVQLMNEERLPWDNALERAQIEAYNSAREAEVQRLARLQNGAPEFEPFPGDLPPGRTVEQPAAPAPRPNMTQEAADRLAAANREYGDMAETYRQGPVKGVLKTNGFADNFTVPDAGVMKRVFTSGDTGYSTVQSFLKAANGRPEALAAIKDYALNDLRAAVRADGTLDPKAFAAWQQRHAQALRAVEEASPGFTQPFADAARASEEMIRAGAQRKQQLDAFRKGEAARFLGKTDPGEVAAQLGAIIKDTKNGPTRMRELVQRAQGSPEALEGLRAAAVDWLQEFSLNAGEMAVSGQRPLSNAKFQKALETYGDTLAVLMPPEIMQNMRVIAADLAKANLKVTATGNAGSPNTAKDLIASKADSATRHSSLIAAMIAGGASGWGFGSMMIGAGTTGAFYILGKLRAAGIDRADAMFRDALLNPERARYYLAKVGEKGTSQAWRNLARSLQRELVIGPALEERRREGYARGGRVMPKATVAPDFMDQINAAIRARMLGGVAPGALMAGPLRGSAQSPLRSAPRL